MTTPKVIRATIANGTSLSDEIALDEASMLALIMPGTWTAAAITFAVSDQSGGTFVPLFDDGGTEATIASANVVASRAISLKALKDVIGPVRYLKIRSGTSAVPVNQAQAVVIAVLVSPLTD